MIKNYIQKILKKFGYQITKLSSGREDSSDFGCLWKDWFSKNPDLFCDIYLTNRKLLNQVETWIDESIISESLWQYGLSSPEAIKKINEFEVNVTYSDLLLYFSRYLKNPTYLELGVSAGKNFYQLAKHLDNAIIAGFDIEKINPILSNLFEFQENLWTCKYSNNFLSFSGKIAELRYSLTQYRLRQNKNKIMYLRGDKFKMDCWNQLQGNQFNIVFSDACHIPESLNSELDFLLKLGLVSEKEFVMLWDDLDGEMIHAFKKAVEKLKNHFGSSNTFSRMYRIHGTYGGKSQLGIHNIGVFISAPSLCEI